jgi:hypothetical protein
MKTVGFLFTVVSWGLFLPGLSLAQPSPQAPEQAPSGTRSQSAKDPHLDEGQGAHTQGKGERTEGDIVTRSKLTAPPLAPAAKPARERQPPSIFPPRSESKSFPGSRGRSAERRGAIEQSRSTSRTAAIPRQLGFSQPAGAAKDRLMNNTTEKQLNRPALSPPPSHFSALPVNPAPGRGPAPAIIGGPTSSLRGKNTAVINGTGMEHRP